MENLNVHIKFMELSKHGKLSVIEIKKWFRKKGLIGGNFNITDLDVESAVSKISEDKNGLDANQMNQCIALLASEKKLKPLDLWDQLAGMNSVWQGCPTNGK